MRVGYELTNVLISVLTYPHPSKQYQETISIISLNAKTALNPTRS